MYLRMCPSNLALSANADSDDPDVHHIISCVAFFIKKGRVEVHFSKKKKYREQLPWKVKSLKAVKETVR